MSAATLPAPVARLVEPVAGTLRRHARVLTVLASLAFAGGSVWAFRNLGISPSDLKWLPLLALSLVMVPASQVYGAVGMVLLARAGGQSMRWTSAMRSNNYAQLAEVLPLPGGAIVRTGALVAAGTNKRTGAMLVTAGAILWIGVAAFAAGLVLWGRGHPAGPVLTLPALVTTLALLVLFVRKAGWRTALALLAHRGVGLVLTALRLWLAFTAVGTALRPFETMPFALATIAGSASSIAPAGLGVSEGMAALIAGSMATAPASAFLAVALNRLVGLGTIAVMVLVDQSRGKPKA